MFTGKYKMADKIIEVNSIYEKVHEYCKDYLTDEPADLSVEMTAEDIIYESRSRTLNLLMKEKTFRIFRTIFLKKLRYIVR